MNGLRRSLFTTAGMLVLACTVLGMVINSGNVFAGGESEWRYSADEIKKLKSSHPDADAVILGQSVTVELDKSGRATRKFMRRVALFTDNAIRRYGDPRILFDSDTQDLEISAACVYMRDGTRVDCKDNAFNQTTPFAFAQAPNYTNWQETVVTHVGIEKDCVAELCYTIRDKVKRKPWLSGVEHLSADDPALVSELILVLPDGARLKHASFNGAPGPESSSGGAYRWRLENVPAVPPVEGGAWEGDFAPTVIYSTAEDWGDISKHMEKMFAVSGTPFSDTDEQTKSLSTREHIFEIHEKTLDCVRGVEAHVALLDRPPRDAGRIYESTYAYPLDRAVLLKAKLAEAGVESVPVLAAAGRTWPHDVPAPEIFDRIFLEVHIDDSGGKLMLDPEHTYLRDPLTMIPGRTIMRCTGEGEIARLPEAPSGANRSSLALTLTVNDEGKIDGEGSASMSGVFSSYHSIRGLENETEEFIKAEIERMFDAASLKTWNIKTLSEDLVELGFGFEAELPEETEHGRIYLTLPEPISANQSGIDAIHAERSSYPAHVGVIPCELDLSVTFDKLAGWKLFGNPLDVDITNSVGSVKATNVKKPAGTQSIGSEVILAKKLVIGKGIIPPEEYGELRSLLLKYNEGRIIFMKNSSE